MIKAEIPGAENAVVIFGLPMLNQIKRQANNYNSHRYDDTQP
jgi:hypothetical protein